MNKNARILIAGAAGMVGSAIVRRLLVLGYTDLIGTYHSHRPAPETFQHPNGGVQNPAAVHLVEANLKDQAAVKRLFQEERPRYVFIAAAKVGGIHANDTYPAQFIYDNLAIQGNLIHAAHTFGVDRLLFLGSSCIYPKLAPQPMQEEHLLTGLLDPTNEPYAIAKIAGIKMCEAFNREYGTRFMAVMPTNLYGTHDNFDLETSHVLPAMIRRFHEAKTAGKEEVVIWGSGLPRREFLHVDDMADACVFVMRLDGQTAVEHFFSYPKPCFVNVGSGVDHSIRELAGMVQEAVGFSGALRFDPAKPDGTPQKLLDVTRMEKLGWQSKMDFLEGIQKTYQWYRKCYEN